MDYVVNFFAEKVPNYSEIIKEQSLKPSPNGVYTRNRKR